MAKIMIVDDSKFMRGIIRAALEEGGHTVIAEAENGNDAVEFYKQHKPDVVTMDVTMWGKDGVEALEDITKFDADAKIIMVSALNETTMKGTRSSVNAKAYLTKPFTKEQLLSAVNSLV